MITAIDYQRLNSILEDPSVEEESATQLEDKLNLSTVVEGAATPRDLVTMNSMLRLVQDDQKPQRDVRILTLVYPKSANLSDGRISIMAPLGVQLLGARVGDVVAWRGPDGHTRKMVVEEILYQPEAHGDWHL